MFFPSKKDLWMAIIFWLFIFLFIIPPIFFPDFGVYMLPDILDTKFIRMIIPFSGAILLLWIWFKTGYTIKDSFIKIEYGPIRKSININGIDSIRATKNLFTDPALSMDKIEINYARFETIAISPKNKIEFVRQLLKQNPNIKTENHFEDNKES